MYTGYQERDHLETNCEGRGEYSGLLVLWLYVVFISPFLLKSGYREYLYLCF